MMNQENKPTKAMLLAAGEGTRLRPLTDQIPKCMVPVGGKPVLEHNIECLRSFGITELMINLHYMPEAVKEYFGDGARWGVNIHYSVEKNLLGTAGGVKNVEPFFDGPFVLWYGDNLSTISLANLWQVHQRRSGLATIALFYRQDPTASGIVGFDDDSRITRFLEKPAPEQIFSHWVSAGIFVLEQPVLDVIPSGVFSDFGRDILPKMLADGLPMFAYQMENDENLWWIDTPEDLQQIQELFQRRQISL